MADPLLLIKIIQFKENIVPVEVTPRELEDRIRNPSGFRGKCDAILVLENLWAEGSGKSKKKHNDIVYLIYIKIIVR
jgi:hypothetical protein